MLNDTKAMMVAHVANTLKHGTTTSIIPKAERPYVQHHLVHKTHAMPLLCDWSRVAFRAAGFPKKLPPKHAAGPPLLPTASRQGLGLGLGSGWGPVGSMPTFTKRCCMSSYIWVPGRASPICPVRVHTGTCTSTAAVYLVRVSHIMRTYHTCQVFEK